MIRNLQTTNAPTTAQLLTVWRGERSLRVGRALSYSALVLSLVTFSSDLYFSSPVVVLAADVLLFLGCALSLYWIKRPLPPAYYWIPLFSAFWISCLPFFWSTGGLNSPYLGVCLAALFVIGTILDPKNRSTAYFVFSLVHLPAFFGLGLSTPSEPAFPLGLSMIVNALNLAAVFLCVHALLKTEEELAREFSAHYQALDKTQDELRKRELQLVEAQSIAKVGSWEWDVTSDRITWSNELFKIFEIDPRSFDPTFGAFLERIKPASREAVRAAIVHAAETGRDFTFEHEIETTRGDKFLLGRGRVIKDEQGKALKMLGTAQDITDRKRIESELRRAHAELKERVKERTLELENANQAKMQFLANMSHEIRTPMNSIIGFADLLATEDHSAHDVKDYLARIRGNGHKLMRLIDDILDLSKFEAGRIPIQKTSFSLKSLIEGVVASFHPELKVKNLAGC